MEPSSPATIWKKRIKLIPSECLQVMSCPIFDLIGTLFPLLDYGFPLLDRRLQGHISNISRTRIQCVQLAPSMIVKLP